MSYDLMVFAPEAAPRDCEAFLAWYGQQTEWSEMHSYDDPVVATPGLRAWFAEIVEQFPPMNGHLASDDPDDPCVTDYSVGKNVIYAAFAWSQAGAARRAVVAAAAKHRVGFFDVSSDDPAIVFPGDSESAVQPAGDDVSPGKPWWRFW
jgi:hypothetical protein